MAKILIGIGFAVLLTGFILLVVSKLGAIGLKVPGDIYIKKGNFSFYFPVVSCLLISLLLTLIINFWSRR
ncbi:MAG: DUF2905 domain-containing protein [Syntrophomonas sp.]